MRSDLYTALPRDTVRPHIRRLQPWTGIEPVSAPYLGDALTAVLPRLICARSGNRTPLPVGIDTPTGVTKLTRLICGGSILTQHFKSRGFRDTTLLSSRKRPPNFLKSAGTDLHRTWQRTSGRSVDTFPPALSHNAMSPLPPRKESTFSSTAHIFGYSPGRQTPQRPEPYPEERKHPSNCHRSPLNEFAYTLPHLTQLCQYPRATFIP